MKMYIKKTKSPLAERSLRLNNLHYCRKNNRGGRFPFSAAGKRLRHGHKATVNRGHFRGRRQWPLRLIH